MVHVTLNGHTETRCHKARKHAGNYWSTKYSAIIQLIASVDQGIIQGKKAPDDSVVTPYRRSWV